ncbi:sterol desaturase family protein [Altererythrobacter salegens]|uniref:Sterol desaturase family protein n=1 Tax=Croceibacterium salegens TaxID=1737568 RepID=A0A6I4SWK8_9SPHN|nr:sterol desaturase family protein [Croceibacterium salegens]MXO59176.1 sterol desaturase family protein [Croceibacterium salegens]
MEALSSQAYAVALALLPVAAAFALLSLVVKRRGALPSLRKAVPETVTNLLLVVLNSVLLAGFFALVTGSLETQLRLFPMLADFWVGVPEIGLLLLALLVDEFVVYWRHRAEHVPALWPIHATHHSDEAMTWLTLLRKHPLSHLFGNIVDSIPLILLGFPAWAVVASSIIRTWWGYFIHADLPWTLGPVGKVLISPAAHRLHHIDDELLMGQNFGGFFSIWDRLFGTFDDASCHLNCRTGIAGGSRLFLGELARPFEAVANRFKRPAASPAS